LTLDALNSGESADERWLRDVVVGGIPLDADEAEALALQATPVVPLPIKGSKTTPSFGVTSLHSHRIKSIGFTVGASSARPYENRPSPRMTRPGACVLAFGSLGPEPFAFHRKVRRSRSPESGFGVYRNRDAVLRIRSDNLENREAAGVRVRSEALASADPERATPLSRRMPAS